MGGIPWQSHGCTTCKQRRIKCDLQKPQCARCMKRGLSCPGYSRDRVFIHHTSVLPVRPSEPKNPGLALLRQAHVTALPQSIHAGPQIRAQLSCEILDAYLPLEPAGTSGVDAWLYLLPNFLALPNRSEMLERAISALSCVYVGKKHCDTQLLHQGVHYYNVSIRLMRKMLCRNTRTPDVLYATVIYQVLEALYCPDGLKAWLAHQEGMNALLRYFRPAAPSNPLVRAIYENQEKVHFMYSGTAIKRPHDQSLPVHSLENGPLDELFRLFVGITEILDNLEQVDRTNYEACQAIHETCLIHKQKVTDWYTQRTDQIGGAPSPCAPDTILCARLPPTDDLFGPVYSFTSLDNAGLNLLSWSALILVQSLVYQSKTLIVAYDQTTPPYPDPVTNEDYALTGHYADQICRAIPYCVQDKMRLGATHMVVASLSQVCKTYALRRCHRKFLWCQRAYLLLADLGVGAALHLHESNEKYWQLSQYPKVGSLLSLSVRLAWPDELAQFKQNMGPLDNGDQDSREVRTKLEN